MAAVLIGKIQTMSRKELFTVSVQLDFELIVEAESLEEAEKLARDSMWQEMEHPYIVIRPRPFSSLDLDDNEFGWNEDCTPIGSQMTLGEILQKED